MFLLSDILSQKDAAVRSYGVYLIRCLPTGQIYVGSSAGPGGIRSRVHRHLRTLILKKHQSKKLQIAFDQYGAEQFEVEILQICENKKQSLAAEQTYLNQMLPFGDKGFNTATHARSTLGLKHDADTRKLMQEAWDSEERRGNLIASSKQRWQDPDYRQKLIGSRAVSFKLEKDGVIYEGTNLAAFAREHGVNRISLGRVLDGTQVCVHGFTLPGNKVPAEPVYCLISPTGEIVEVTNQTQFAAKYGLHQASVHKVCSGTVRHHKGWKLKEVKNTDQPVMPKPAKPTRRLQSPTGEVFEFTEVAQFARDHGLRNTCLHSLFAGVNRQHQGWRVPNTV